MHTILRTPTLYTERHIQRRGQAVIEMALILPIIIFLTVSFVGIMSIAITSQRLHTALILAASTAVADKPDDPSACGDAISAFESTLFGGPLTVSSSSCTAHMYDPMDPSIDVTSITCVSNGVTGGGYFVGVASDAVSCSATLTINFSHSALGVALSGYRTSITSAAVVQPTGYRQCFAAAGCTNPGAP